MDDYPWLSVLPPLIAIVLAIITRRVVLSLFAGVLLGTLIIARGNPFDAIPAALETHIWAAVINEDHLRVFGFTLLMGAMVGVIHRSGGMLGIVECLAPLAKSRRVGQLTTWILGLVVFFDDYANTMLLGTTMRPLTDRLKISREKLAYLVDSTAAPVAGLALVSTWIAGEIGYIESGLEGLQFSGDGADGLGFFIASIPYRFYVLWALLMVGIVAVSNRDFGPMLTAERNTQAKQPVDDASNGDETNHHWYNAVVPIAVTIAVVLWLLNATGRAALAEDPDADASWLNVFGNANSYVALLYGSLAGLIAAVALACSTRALSLKESGDAAFEGAKLMLPALAILWMAWSLSGLTGADYLATGTYLGGVLKQGVSAAWMPTVVFLLASAVAFSTGTSWGTMSLLTPLVIQTTHAMLSVSSTVDAGDPILVASIGSVLAGAIFGDHCSPISDTTVLSSQASGCDHVAHVRTQLPYALLVGAASVLCGTIPIGFGVSVWFALPSGVAALIVFTFVFGRRAV